MSSRRNLDRLQQVGVPVVMLSGNESDSSLELEEVYLRSWSRVSPSAPSPGQARQTAFERWNTSPSSDHLAAFEQWNPMPSSERLVSNQSPERIILHPRSPKSLNSPSVDNVEQSAPSAGSSGHDQLQCNTVIIYPIDEGEKAPVAVSLLRGAGELPKRHTAGGRRPRKHRQGRTGSSKAKAN